MSDSCKLVETSRIFEDPLNPNSMNEATFQSLCVDIRARGIDAIEPIHIYPVDLQSYRSSPDGYTGDFRVADGNHRLRAAKHCNLDHVRALTHPFTEEARAFGYRKNVIRGRIDPFREAQLFQELKNRGWTQERIAKTFFGTAKSRPLVSQRLSLLKLTDEVRAEIESLELPWTSASVLSSMAPEEQRLALLNIKRHVMQTGRQPSRRQVQVMVNKVGRAHQKRQITSRHRGSQVEVAVLALFLKIMGIDPNVRTFSGMGFNFAESTMRRALKQLVDRNVLKRSGQSYIFSGQTRSLLKSLKTERGVDGLARFLAGVLDFT